MLSRFSLGLTFCIAALVGCTTATSPGADSNSEEAEQTESLTAAPVSQAEIAAIKRMPKISEKQLVEMLGDRVPATAGKDCTNLFQTCDASIDSPITPCSGFQGVCGSQGTQTALPLRFLCIPKDDDSGIGKCQALQNGDPHPVSCFVSTEGKACSTGCNPDTCDYNKTCDMTGKQMRRCFSGGTCSHDQCANQTFTDSQVGTCTRPEDTAGKSCPMSDLLLSDQPCNAPRAPLCSAASHRCACLLGAQ